MQKAYINAVYELAEKDENVILLTADNGTDFDKWFKTEFPQRYFDMGLSECNMISVAAGIASCGKIVFAQTGGSFLTYRALEFIRNDVCLQRQNVKIIGTGSGLSISNLGPTHHSTEDIAILRSLPGLTILSPATTKEVASCIKAAYDVLGPVYIRIGMESELEDFDVESSWNINSFDTIIEGHKAVLFSTGSIISEALKCKDMLQTKSIQLVNVHTLKPICEKYYLDCINGKKYAFTLEEHNIIGGLGGIISEIIATNNLDVKLIRIGIEDVFAKGYGNYDDIRKTNGINANSITSIINKFL